MMDPYDRLILIDQSTELDTEEKKNLALISNQLGNDSFIDVDFVDMCELLEIDSEEDLEELLFLGEELGIFHYDDLSGELIPI